LAALIAVSTIALAPDGGAGRQRALRLAGTIKGREQGIFNFLRFSRLIDGQTQRLAAQFPTQRNGGDVWKVGHLHGSGKNSFLKTKNSSRPEISCVCFRGIAVI
jgi:hypothetical protein